MQLKVKSWNIFTGCNKVSPACKNCYAEVSANKLNKWGTSGYENNFKFTIHSERLEKAEPLRRKKPTLYFINNMSDTFHEDATDLDIDKIIEIVRMANWHNFYILSKRSKRMYEYFKTRTIPNNLWIGVTVENKEHGLSRLEDLHRIKANNKHICCEPLLEDLGEINLRNISLVVGGGESGKAARKTNLSWVESLREQCKKQNTHFYWKSWGSYSQNGIFKASGKNGCLINGKEYLSFPDNLIPNNKNLNLFNYANKNQTSY